MSNITEGATVRVRLGGIGRPPQGTVLKAYKAGNFKVQITTGYHTGEIVKADAEDLTVL